MKKVLIILLDDVSKVRLRKASTPNIDRLRTIGRSFPLFTAAPVCSNARAKLVSGLYTHRANNLAFGNFKANKDRGFLPIHSMMLGASTFAPQWLGKWHLTDGERPDHPQHHGFDFDGSLHNFAMAGETYGRWQRTRNLETSWENVHATELVAGEAAINLRANARLVVLAFNAAHKPLHYPPGYGGPEDDEMKTLAMIEHVDQVLREVLAAAFDHDYQVIFTSDQAGRKAEGGKGTLREETLNTELILAGSTVCGRGESDQVVDMTDLHATAWTWLTGLCPMGVDGIPLVGMVSPRKFAFADMSQKVGTLPDAWDRSVRSPRVKVIAIGWDAETLGQATQEWLVYDLQKDPGELKNRVSEPAYQAALEVHKAALVEAYSSEPGAANLTITFRKES